MHVGSETIFIHVEQKNFEAFNISEEEGVDCMRVHGRLVVLYYTSFFKIVLIKSLNTTLTFLHVLYNDNSCKTYKLNIHKFNILFDILNLTKTNVKCFMDLGYVTLLV